jgi:hypothetical protein
MLCLFKKLSPSVSAWSRSHSSTVAAMFEKSHSMWKASGSSAVLYGHRHMGPTHVNKRTVLLRIHVRVETILAVRTEQRVMVNSRCLTRRRCTIPRNSSSLIVLRIFQGYRDDECVTGLLTQQLFYAFARCSNTLLSEQFLTYHCNFPQLYFIYAIVMTHVGPNVWRF